MCQAEKSPKRPAGLAPFHERKDHEEQSDGGKHDPARIQFGGCRRAHFAHPMVSSKQSHHANGQIHQKDRPPAEPPNVRFKQFTAQHIAREGPEPDDDAKNAERQPASWGGKLT